MSGCRIKSGMTNLGLFTTPSRFVSQKRFNKSLKEILARATAREHVENGAEVMYKPQVGL